MAAGLLHFFDDENAELAVSCMKIGQRLIRTGDRLQSEKRKGKIGHCGHFSPKMFSRTPLTYVPTVIGNFHIFLRSCSINSALPVSLFFERFLNYMHRGSGLIFTFINEHVFHRIASSCELEWHII